MAFYQINSQLTALGDIQRQYGFKVVIEPPASMAKAWGATGIIFSLVREVNLPGRVNTPIESNFVGMKQKFPGKEEFSGNFTVTLEESDNLDALNLLYEWKQKIFNVNSGAAPVPSVLKNTIMGSASVYFLDYSEAPKKQYVKVHNIWPVDMPDIQLAYANGSDSVKIPINFAYDYWTFENTGDFAAGTGATYGTTEAVA